MSQFLENSTLLINKLSVATDATSIATLAEGELNVINAKTGAILSAGATYSDAPEIQIVRGGASSDHDLSQVIQGKNVRGWKGNSYAALTAQVDTFTITDPTSPVPVELATGDLLNLVIVMQSNDIWGKQRQDRRVIQVAWITDDATTATALAAAVNADEYVSNYITATAPGADTVVLTAKAQTYNVNDNGFRQVIFDSAIEVEDISQTTESLRYSKLSAVKTTNPSPGVGTVNIVKDLERATKYSRGLSNFTKFPTPTGATDTDTESTATYDMYYIAHDHVHPSADLNNQIASPCGTIIAIPSANTTVTTAIEAILNPWMASCPGAFANVNL